MTPPRTVDVLGVDISVIDQARSRDILFDSVRNDRRGYVAVTGVHGVMEAQEDEGFRSILNNALLTTPDGMPMVWMGKLQGEESIARVYGPDLMLNLCDHSHRPGPAAMKANCNIGTLSGETLNHRGP